MVSRIGKESLPAALVRPGDSPVLPEMISNGDGEKKQDCELVAGERWISRHREAYRHLKPTLLGDDLYSHEPFCRQVVEVGWHFIFICKDSTHLWLRETVEHSGQGEVSRREWNGRYHLVHTYRRVNGVQIGYQEKEEDTFLIIWNEEKGKRTCCNIWIMDKPIEAGNVKPPAACGRTGGVRARWKIEIENEHNKVLKNHGYNLEHNVETKFPMGKERTMPVRTFAL